MRLLTKFICIVCLFCLASCSGGRGYDSALCSTLVEKIKDKQELSEKDYNEMIDQFGAIVTWMAKEKKAAGGDEAAFKAALQTDQGKEMAEYMIYFGLEFDSAKDKLSASNVARLAKYMKEMKELKE